MATDEQLGRMVRLMLPNTALFKHNDDKYTYRTCIMDGVWDLQKSGYPSLMRDIGMQYSPEGALAAGQLIGEEEINEH